MSSTEYASAVAAVKAMESSLLTHSDMEQLINARTVSELKAIAGSKNAEASTLEDVWEMIRSYAPDSRELTILLYKNDFHDLKAGLKAMFSGRDADEYYIYPSNIESGILKKLLSSKEFDSLPAYMAETAAQAYDLLTRTMDGQLSDSLIDSSALAAIQRDSDSFGGAFMQKYAQLTTVCADIKTAYRCALMGKPRQFMEIAVCGSRELDKESLIRAAMGGVESLMAFLESTSYKDAAAILKESPAQFEKWCDDVIMEHAESARMQAFGVEPLAAYYIAKEAELKNLRIITVCQECGADRETVMERMRKLYV